MSSEVYQRLQWDFMGKRWAAFLGYAAISIFGVYVQYAFLPEKVAGLTKVLSTRSVSPNEPLFSNVWKNIVGNESVGGLIVVLIGAYVLISAVDLAERNIEMAFLPQHMEHCRTVLFKQLVQRYREEYDDVPSAEVIARVLSVSKIFVYQSEYIIGTLFPYVIGLIVVVVYSFRKNKTVGAVITTSLVLSLGTAFLWGAKIANTSKKREGVFVNMVEKMNNSFTNLMNVYVNNKEKDTIAENQTLNDEQTLMFQKELAVTRNSSFTTTAISIVGFASLLIVGFHLVRKQKIKSFDLAAISTLYIMYMSWSLKILDGLPYIFRRVGIWMQNMPFVENLFNRTHDAAHYATIRDGSVSVANLSFEYPSAADKPVLRDITLNIQQGERVAIVGRSGSGKTTLMKLLVGLYKPTSGTIRIGGANIKNVDKTALRQQVAYINQRTTLSNDTILDNIRYGNDASRQEVASMLDTYDLRAVFSDIQGGIDAEAGVRGANLSLGMAKTVIVLRGLLRKGVKVYLFDEPVAGLDALTRRKIMNMIAAECKGKTVICVTHSEAIKSFVDRVIQINP